MKVEDLIKELSAFNQKAEITTPYSETIRVSWISDEDEDIQKSKKDTVLVFIEGCDFIEEEDTVI